MSESRKRLIERQEPCQSRHISAAQRATAIARSHFDRRMRIEKLKGLRPRGP